MMKCSGPGLDNVPCRRPVWAKGLCGSHYRQLQRRGVLSPIGLRSIKTECVNGHPLDGDNLYISPSGVRACQECRRRAGREAARRRSTTIPKKQPTRCAMCSEMCSHPNARYCPTCKPKAKRLNRDRWKESNPDLARLCASLYASKRRKWYRSGSVSADQALARVAMFGGRCWICRGKAEALDHVKPLAKGGLHLPCNLRPICQPCNNKKGAKWPWPHAN